MWRISKRLKFVRILKLPFGTDTNLCYDNNIIIIIIIIIIILMRQAYTYSYSNGFEQRVARQRLRKHSTTRNNR
jgi:hypothetical protein